MKTESIHRYGPSRVRFFLGFLVSGCIGILLANCVISFRPAAAALPNLLGWLIGSVIMSLMPWRAPYDIVITNTAVTGPIRRGLKRRTVTVPLGDILIDESRNPSILMQGYLRTRDGSSIAICSKALARAGNSDIIGIVKDRAAKQEHGPATIA